MGPEIAKVFDGKKYMWDGEEYDEESNANEKAEKYKEDNFEVQVVTGEDGKFLVYSRRIAAQQSAEGS